MEIEIIRLLRRSGGGKAGHVSGHVPGHVSGQEISEKLGISRTAVWKHVGALRRSGYSIEGSTKKGYSLTEDASLFNSIEVSSTLDTSFIGTPLHFFDTLESTNSEAAELARGGSAEGTAVIADTQTGGRGRVGRVWHSPAGVNLYTSVILRPPIEPRRAPSITLVAAVAAAEAISRFCGDAAKTTVKWPNDIMINSKKAAGILTEMSSETERINYIIVGFGVNLMMTGAETKALSSTLGRPVTSVLAETGGAKKGGAESAVSLSRSAFTKSLYSALEKWYKVYVDDGLPPVREAWLGYFTALDKEVTISPYGGAPDVSGTCLGIDDDGALLLKTPGGTVERITAGEMG